MELSIGEMLVIAIAIVVLFGPNKLPQIARDLGQGVRNMRGVMEDVKTEIMKETDNPDEEIKREIDKVKEAAQNYNPLAEKAPENAPQREPVVRSQAEDDSYERPVSR